jgi:hypothetical protein
MPPSLLSGAFDLPWWGYALAGIRGNSMTGYRNSPSIFPGGTT